jgi:hypothetical protein
MDTVAILAYFNFSQKKNRDIALRETLRHLSQQVDIILVCYGLQTDSILPANNIHIVNIQSASIVWQKERFYSIALSHLNHNHKYVVWVDADLLFTQPDWQAQLKEKLERYRLVQLFNRVEDVKLENSDFSSTGLIRKSVVESWGSDITIEDYFNKSGISLQIGCNPGFGWAAKVDTIREIDFADFMIMGSGDKILLASAMGCHAVFIKTLSLNQSLYNLSLHWGEKVFQAIEGQVSYLENTIYHVVQGDYNNRNYSKRYQLINDDRFVVNEYLKINEYGAWQWINANNEYARIIENYFHERKD